MQGPNPYSHFPDFLEESLFLVIVSYLVNW